MFDRIWRPGMEAKIFQNVMSELLASTKKLKHSCQNYTDPNWRIRHSKFKKQWNLYQTVKDPNLNQDLIIEFDCVFTIKDKKKK